jgi:trans-aconitate 2-methyltransferase
VTGDARPVTVDGWDPRQYDRFRDERQAPFFDLLALVAPVPGGQVVDLGCGTGELTRELHRRSGAATTIGIDSSPAMLAEAAVYAGDGLSFQPGTIEGFRGEALDVVFANASLHWVPDHHELLGRLTASLGPGGQLAFQVPANFDHPSHRLAADIAAEAPFADALAASPVEGRAGHVLAPEAYAELLAALGFAEQHVRLQVYGHHLDSTDEVVEWVKGTLLTPYRARLETSLYDEFVAELRTRLRREVGDRAPYFYAFKRILCRARLP